MSHPVRAIWTSLGIVALCMVTAARAVEFNEIARFSLGTTANFLLDPEDPESVNPSFIGSNPSAVAWNGSQLYVAGFDNGGEFGDVAIVEVLNATAPGVNEDPTYSNAFGQFLPQTIFRGYSGLDLQGTTLVAAYDHGVDHPNGLQAFDTTDNSLIWAKESRGTSGVAFDPGFPTGDPALGTGVAWTTFASGRRALQDAATGDDIYVLDGTSVDPPPGLIWIQTPPPSNNFPRDMAFDPDTGDIYVRRSNDVHKATRTGDNSAADQTFLVDNGGNGAFVNQQNLDFLSNTVDGDLVIYNDRTDGSTRPFDDVIKVVDTSGVAQSATFNLIGGLTSADINDGGGNYDFDFDPASQTLALLDSFNRNVFIFQVGPLAEGLPGDYNENNIVDAADYTVWQDNFGAQFALPNEDPNTTPGQVTQDDYDFWLSQFGNTAVGSLSTNPQAVPEPTSGAIWLASVLLAGWTRRRSFR